MTNTFDARFKAIQPTIEFDTSWHNGTGYLDDMVRADLGIAYGDQAKCIDDLGRRIIITATSLGNVVVFERYVPEDNVYSKVWVCNAPTKLSMLRDFSGGLSDDDVTWLTTLPKDEELVAQIEAAVVDQQKIDQSRNDYSPKSVTTQTSRDFVGIRHSWTEQGDLTITVGVPSFI